MPTEPTWEQALNALWLALLGMVLHALLTDLQLKSLHERLSIGSEARADLGRRVWDLENPITVKAEPSPAAKPKSRRVVVPPAGEN